LTAFWGNDDAESTIKVSRRMWKKIQEGAEYKKSTWSWYEGHRYSVSWLFAQAEINIYGEHGAHYVVQEHVDSLLTEIVTI
jgi:hypothetical protein